MNSLEWINKQIEKYKCFYEEDKDYKEIQEGWGKLIVRFQQIKTQLEAWEVIKKYVKEISINGIVFEHIINVSHTKQNYEIIKKALEIENGK